MCIRDRPKAIRIAVLVNPANASIAETTLREVQEAAPTIGPVSYTHLDVYKRQAHDP